MKNMNAKGFTLIELMIVIAIIAILLSLALPAYQDYTVRTKVAEALSVAAAAKLAVAETCQSDPNITPDNTTVGYDFTASTYVLSVTVSGTCGAPVVTMITQATGAATAPTLVLTGLYTALSGHIEWLCTHTTGSDAHVPATCR